MRTLVLLAALFAVAQGSTICRTAKPGTLIGDPLNCRDFFMCRPGGRPVRFTCPEGTVFHKVSLACDATSFAICETGPDPIDEEFTPMTANPSRVDNATRICASGSLVGTLWPDPRSCATFYQCSNAGAILFECPPGTLFDGNRLHCERSDIASCALSTHNRPAGQPSVSNSMQRVLDLGCRGRANGAKFAHPLSCTQYVQCNGQDRAHVFRCASGTAFDRTRKICNWEHQVTC